MSDLSSAAAATAASIAQRAELAAFVERGGAEERIDESRVGGRIRRLHADLVGEQAGTSADRPACGGASSARSTALSARNAAGSRYGDDRRTEQK